MKREIRKGLFETNSSSTHSLTLCSGNEYDGWKEGKYVYCRDGGTLVPVTDADYLEWKKMTDEEKRERWCERDYLTYEKFWDYFGDYYENYEGSYVTENGDKVVAFGYYGYDN